MSERERAPVSGQFAVWPEFYTEAVQNQAGSREAGHAVFDDVEMVRLHKRGTTNQATEERVATLRKHKPDMWAFLDPYYQSWKRGLEGPVDGSALANWPPISKAMLQTLRALHIHTVEALAALTDADVVRVGPGAIRLRDQARAWATAAEQTGKIAEQLVARDERISAQAAQIAELTEAVEALRAQVEARKARAKEG
jgi:hypothetical protein